MTLVWQFQTCDMVSSTLPGTISPRDSYSWDTAEQSTRNWFAKTRIVTVDLLCFVWWLQQAHFDNMCWSPTCFFFSGFLHPPQRNPKIPRVSSNGLQLETCRYLQMCPYMSIYVRNNPWHASWPLRDIAAFLGDCCVSELWIYAGNSDAFSDSSTPRTVFLTAWKAANCSPVFKARCWYIYIYTYIHTMIYICNYIIIIIVVIIIYIYIYIWILYERYYIVTCVCMYIICVWFMYAKRIGPQSTHAQGRLPAPCFGMRACKDHSSSLQKRFSHSDKNAQWWSWKPNGQMAWAHAARLIKYNHWCRSHRCFMIFMAPFSVWFHKGPLVGSRSPMPFRVTVKSCWSSTFF